MRPVDRDMRIEVDSRVPASSYRNRFRSDPVFDPLSAAPLVTSPQRLTPAVRQNICLWLPAAELKMRLTAPPVDVPIVVPVASDPLTVTTPVALDMVKAAP